MPLCVTPIGLQINGLVRSVLQTGNPDVVTCEISIDLKEDLVSRYLKNKEMFMQTFLDGIAGVVPDPAAV